MGKAPDVRVDASGDFPISQVQGAVVCKRWLPAFGLLFGWTARAAELEKLRGVRRKLQVKTGVLQVGTGTRKRPGAGRITGSKDRQLGVEEFANQPIVSGKLRDSWRNTASAGTRRQVHYHEVKFPGLRVPLDGKHVLGDKFGAWGRPDRQQFAAAPADGAGRKG